MTKLSKTSQKFDVIIIGAGPAGLAFAVSLAQQNLAVVVLEKEAETALRKPAPDGREIALTHASVATMQALGIYQRIDPDAIAPIRDAKVMDGSSSRYFLQFAPPQQVKNAALGFIVPNHLIRKAVYDQAKTHKNITLLTGVSVEALSTDDHEGRVTLGNGAVLHAPLVVAADGRFSAARRRMGVPVAMQDFGRSIIVCRFAHEKPHHGTAYECFNYERTLAMLPLHGNHASAVITLPSDQVADFMALSPAALAADVAARFDHRLGAMRLVGDRHVYPLVATYAQRFTGNRFALLGDAAVGMHPVTAHGYNFGLKGQKILAELITESLALGLDIGTPAQLEAYHRRHRAATLPLYMATNALVKLYTAETPRAKLLRRAGLHAANLLTPIKKFVTDYLADAA